MLCKALRGISRPLAVMVMLLSMHPAQAQNTSLKVLLDPAQTEIHWKLGGLHTTHGTFKLKSGELLFNPATGVAEGEILVDAASGESGNKARDQRMQQEVLESNRYPAIFFHPVQIKGPFKPGEQTQVLQAQGTFNIHGTDHQIVLPVTVQVTANAVTASTTFTIPYVAWGMKDPSRLFLRVGKEVEVEVKTKGAIEHAE